MNIVLINHYAGSDYLGMEYRPFYFAREWVAAGHNVTIVAATYSHLRGRQPEVKADLETTEEEGVRFRWLRANRYNGNGTWRLVNMGCFLTKLYAHADRIAREERPDLVICSSTYPLDVYPGDRITRKSAACLVFEVHDLWPLTPILLGGYSPRHPYIQVLQRAEDWAYRRADAVISLLPDARAHMIERGLDPHKFAHIPNGIPFAYMSQTAGGSLSPAVDDLISTERARGRFLVGYAGGINLNMAIETVLDAAHALSGDNVSFIIAGDGSRAELLRARLNCCGAENFHMVGRIPKASVPVFLASMDVLAIPWHRSPLYRYGVSPNKMLDYMLAGRPVIQASDASNDLVTEAGCGLTVPPEDPRAFADAVRYLRGLSEAQLRSLGENGQRFVRQNHDCRILAQRFLTAVMQAPLAGHSALPMPQPDCAAPPIVALRDKGPRN